MGTVPGTFHIVIIFMICIIVTRLCGMGVWIYRMGMSVLHNWHVDFEQWLLGHRLNFFRGEFTLGQLPSNYTKKKVLCTTLVKF